MAIIHRTNAFMYYAHRDFLKSNAYSLTQAYTKPSKAKINSFTNICLLVHEYHTANPCPWSTDRTPVKIIRKTNQSYTVAFELVGHSGVCIFVVLTKDNAYWCTFDELAKYYNF